MFLAVNADTTIGIRLSLFCTTHKLRETLQPPAWQTQRLRMAYIQGKQAVQVFRKAKISENAIE